MDWFWVGIYTDIPRVATPLTLRWHVHGVLYSHSRVRFLQYTVTKIVKSCQTYWKVAQIIDQTNVRFVLYVNKCVKMNRLLWTRTEWYVDRGRRIDVHDTLVSGWWCPLSVCLSVCLSTNLRHLSKASASGRCCSNSRIYTVKLTTSNTNI